MICYNNYIIQYINIYSRFRFTDSRFRVRAPGIKILDSTFQGVSIDRSHAATSRIVAGGSSIRLSGLVDSTNLTANRMMDKQTSEYLDKLINKLINVSNRICRNKHT